MTISLVASSPPYRAPRFESLRRLLARFRRMEQGVSSRAQTSESARLSKALQQCVGAMDEWLPELQNSLQSMDLDATVLALHGADQKLLACSSDEEKLESLLDQRERLSQTVCTSLRIAAGTLRTAVDELETQLRAVRILEHRDSNARYEYLIADLQQIADQWSKFAERMSALEYPSMTAQMVQGLVNEQNDFLRELSESHHNATCQTSR